ncbi:MAG: response regulator, partial [Stellaceae bacterium]
RLLVGEGWVVTTARNGREAVERLTAEPPQLILLDLLMPEMDGFEVLARLRQDRALAAIPVVIITAADLTDEQRKRLQGGVELIVEKAGYGQDDLLIEIRRIIARYAVPAESAVGV